MKKRKKTEDSMPMLDRPIAALSKPEPISAFFFYAVLLLLGGLGAMGCFFAAFQIPLDPRPVFLMGAACALLCPLQFLPGQRHKWLLAIVPPIIWGLALWWKFHEAAQGCFHTVGPVLAAYGEKLRIPMPAIPTDFADPGKAKKLTTLFAVFLQFPFFEALSWLFVRHKSALGAFCLTGLFLLVPLAISILPGFWALGFLLLFWAFLLFAASFLRRGRQPAESGGRFRFSGSAFARPAALLLLPVLGLCMLLIYRACPPETYERPQIANDIRSGLTTDIDLPAALRNLGGLGRAGSGSRVDLSALGERSYTGKTALRVRHKWENSGAAYAAGKDYLKNFVGSVYTGTGWEQLSRTDAAAAQEVLGNFHAQTLPADLAKAYPSEEELRGDYRLSVENVGADPRSVYVPYGLSGSEALPDGMEYEGDGCLQASGLTAPKEYSLSASAAVEPGISMPGRFMEAVFGPPEEIYTEQHSIETEDGAPLTIFKTEKSYPGGEVRDRLLEEQLQFEEAGGKDAAELWRIPDWAKEDFSEHDWSLLEAAERYTVFVYDHYTQLPDSTRAFLEDYMARHWGGDPDFSYSRRPEDRERTLLSVRFFLAEQCSYTLSPPTLPEGRDFVEYFLEESREGYCVHFATAAVALLRAMGIPARYAEGYAVPAGADGNWDDIPDYNAHAWVEVYWGGTGWLPVEMTPASPNAPAAYTDAAGPYGGTASSPSPTASASPAPDGSAPPPEPTSAPAPTVQPVESAPAAASSPAEPVGPAGPSATGEKAPADLSLLPLVLLLPALFLLAFAQRRLRIVCRQRAYRQEDRNRAALRVYAHLLRLYRETARLPGGETAPPEDIEELALRARFSDHTLTREELEKLITLAAALEKQLEKELSVGARLRCQYLSALF